MRRVSPPRIFFCLGSLLCGLLLLGDVHQTFKAFTVNVIYQYDVVFDITVNETATKHTKESAKNVDK